MKIESLKIAVCTVIGVVGGFIANLFGGWTSDLITLIIFMTIDFVMGLIVAGVFKKSNKSDSGAIESKAGWKGLCRKGVTLLIVLIAHRLDIALQVDFVRTATIIGYIANELISIIENAGLMGVPIPARLKQAIEILRDKSDSDETGDGKEVIEKLLYPLFNMRITQGYMSGSSHYAHSHSKDGIIDYSLDDGEKDTGNNDFFLAPCTLKIVEIYLTGTNTFWWESVDEVILANGKKSKVCGYVIHCPDSSLKKMKVGQIFKQGEKVAQEGTDGASAFHFHHAVALGSCKKLSDCPRPWKLNAAGAYVLTSTGGAIKPEDAYFVYTKQTKILNDGGIKWIKTDEPTENIRQNKITYDVVTDKTRQSGEVKFDMLPGDENEVLKADIIFKEPFTKTPRIFTSVNSSGFNSDSRFCNVSKNGATIIFKRSDVVDTSVNWLAVGE